MLLLQAQIHAVPKKAGHTIKCVLSVRKLALCFFGASQLKLLNVKRGSCTIIEHVSRHALTLVVAVGIKKEKELETWL